MSNLIAAIHAEKSKLKMSDQDYRLLIVTHFGAMSSKALKPHEQLRLLDLLKGKAPKKFTQADLISKLLKEQGLKDEYATTIADKIQKVSHWKFAGNQVKAAIIRGLKRRAEKGAKHDDPAA